MFRSLTQSTGSLKLCRLDTTVLAKSTDTHSVRRPRLRFLTRDGIARLVLRWLGDSEIVSPYEIVTDGIIIMRVQRALSDKYHQLMGIFEPRVILNLLIHSPFVFGCVMTRRTLRHSEKANFAFRAWVVLGGCNRSKQRLDVSHVYRADAQKKEARFVGEPRSSAENGTCFRQIRHLQSS